MRVRAVLFDAHGVLVEAAEPVGETYSRFLAQHGIQIPGWRIEDGLRRILNNAPPIRYALGTRGDPIQIEYDWWKDRVREVLQAVDSTLIVDDFPELFDRLFRHFGQAETWALCPSACETLEKLRRKHLKTGIVSNWDHRLIGILEGLGIAELIDITAIPIRSGFAKPNPRAFFHALEALGVPADQTLFVGHDPVLDEAAARSAGLIPLMVEGSQTLSSIPTRVEEIATLSAQ